MSRISSFLALALAAAPVVSDAFAAPRELFSGHNGGCYWIQDRASCCKHTDGRNYSEAGHYFNEYCVPAAEGTTFTSGQICEPECWVHGHCGDGIPQGDRVGRCHASDDNDDHILVVSEDTTTTFTRIITMTFTTTAAPPSAVQLSRKDKIIAGAVAGSVGSAALLGGLLGGLLTPATTEAPNVTMNSTSTTTTVTSHQVRFLGGDNLLDNSGVQHLGSPWLAALGLGAFVSVAAFAMVFHGMIRRKGARSFNGAAEVAESTDDESTSPAARSGPDAFDLIDKNHDGVISKEEFTAAFGRAQPVTMAPTFRKGCTVYVEAAK